MVPAGDPRNPTGGDVHFANGLHEAVDLDAAAGDCVYAAYSGRVVEVESNRAGTRGNVTIDHHPRGLGFVTKYNHITDIRVTVGDFVRKGVPFAAVSADPAEPHLHFELWVVAERDTAARAWPGDNDLVPVDPTRALYAWERRTAPDEPVAGRAPPGSVGVTTISGVPFFVATIAGESLHVPLYEPITDDERLIVAILRDAHRTGVDTVVHRRASAFWGVDVVTRVALA